ncbi:hypothetical protein BH11PLA1_BH11PLA1_04430 [soil metagenome]
MSNYRPSRSRFITPLALLLGAGLWLFPASARAWDAAGHRAVTWLALEGLDPSFPAFLRDPSVVHAVGWESAEPDRYRSLKSAILTHANAPDHYIDVDDLDEFGLTLDTINPLRARFIRDMSVARAAHKDGDTPEPTGGRRDRDTPPYNEKRDPSGQSEFVGFLPYAICEHHARLTSSLKTYRTLLRLNDPARAPQLDMAKANVMVNMGMLSHFVGDAAQPLHTTRHHNGWVGRNDNNYTTNKGFHAKIDGGVIAKHAISFATLKPTQKYAHTIADPLNPWPEVIAHIRRSNDLVEKTYQLERAGEFENETGKAFIVARLNDGADMLAALYNAAWRASEPSETDVKDLVRYDTFKPADLPAAAGPKSVAPVPDPQMSPAPAVAPAE